MATKKKGELARNRKARHDFHVLESFEAGIVLVGTEVKSCRDNRISMQDPYTRIMGGEAFLFNVHIDEFTHGNRFNHEATRPRKLLLHKAEIRKIKQAIDTKGLTAVPLCFYLKRGKVKVEIGICRGKTKGDKRESLKKRDAAMEIKKAMKYRD